MIMNKVRLSRFDIVLVRSDYMCGIEWGRFCSTVANKGIVLLHVKDSSGSQVSQAKAFSSLIPALGLNRVTLRDSITEGSY